MCMQESHHTGEMFADTSLRSPETINQIFEDPFNSTGLTLKQASKQARGQTAHSPILPSAPQNKNPKVPNTEVFIACKFI